MQFTHNLNIWQPWECAGTNSCFTYPAPHYNGLIEYNPETDDLVDIRGDLAKGWELGDDGVTYIFPLHENVRWHDGMPLTAKDVVFSLDSMTDPDESRPVVGKLGIFYESSRAIDEYTVEVKTKFPAPAFMPSLATEYHKMMAKHWLETGVDMKLRENVMGSGPYKPGKAELNVLVEYLRNEDYFKEGRPYFDSMTYFIISDQGTTNAAFRAGQVLFHANPSSGLSNKESLALAEDMKGRARVIFDGPVAPLWVQFNTNREPFTDPRVRHALHLVAHRQPFIQTFSPGIDRLGGPFPPGFWFGISEEDLEKLPGYRQTPDGKKHPDDIAEAKRLLKEAGVPDNFKAKVASPNFVEFPQMASIMADQLRTFLGWDAASDTTQTATWVEQRNSGQFQLSVGGYGLLILDPHDLLNGIWTKDASSNITRWSHPRIEEIAELQARELDQVKRKALIDEAAKILMEEDNWHAPLYWTMRGHFSAIQIQNHHPVAALTDALKVEHYWCDPAC